MDELAAAAPGVSGDGEASERGQLGGQVPHRVGRQAVRSSSTKQFPFIGSEIRQGAWQVSRLSPECD